MWRNPALVTLCRHVNTLVTAEDLQIWQLFYDACSGWTCWDEDETWATDLKFEAMSIRKL